MDARIQRDDEYSDSEDEGEGGRRDRKSHKNASSAGTSKLAVVQPLAPPSPVVVPISSPVATLSALTPAAAPPLPVQREITTEEIDAMERELLEEDTSADAPRATTSAARATTEAAVGEDDGAGLAMAIPPIAPVVAPVLQDDVVMGDVAPVAVAPLVVDGGPAVQLPQ